MNLSPTFVTLISQSIPWMDSDKAQDSETFQHQAKNDQYMWPGANRFVPSKLYHHQQQRLSTGDSQEKEKKRKDENVSTLWGRSCVSFSWLPCGLDLFQTWSTAGIYLFGEKTSFFSLVSVEHE